MFVLYSPDYAGFLGWRTLLWLEIWLCLISIPPPKLVILISWCWFWFLFCKSALMRMIYKTVSYLSNQLAQLNSTSLEHCSTSCLRADIQLLCTPKRRKAEHHWDDEESCALTRLKRDYFKIPNFQNFWYKKIIFRSAQLTVNAKDSSEAWINQSFSVFSASLLVMLLAPLRFVNLLSAISKSRGWNWERN